MILFFLVVESEVCGKTKFYGTVICPSNSSSHPSPYSSSCAHTHLREAVSLKTLDVMQKKVMRGRRTASQHVALQKSFSAEIKMRGRQGGREWGKQWGRQWGRPSATQ